MSTGPITVIVPTAKRATQVPPAPDPEADWPLLGGFEFYGGYMISDQSGNFENDPAGLPSLDWNAEKDVLIIQTLGWRISGLLDSAAERIRRIKDINPDIKIGWYFLPAEVSKDTGVSSVGYPDEIYDLINSPTRGTTNWYQVDVDGNKLESQFDPPRIHRANAYVPQFNDNNSFGRTMIEQFWAEHEQAFTEVRANGERLIDLIDFAYWDALDSGLERTFADGSDGSIARAPDQNRDGSAEGRFSEDIPANVDDEDGYGGARMQRRGAMIGLREFESVFAGTNTLMWRNGTKDGILYTAQNLSDPPDTNEFYQQFDGSIHERINNDLGLRDNGTGYDVAFDNFESGIGRHVRIRRMCKPADLHAWGAFGYYGLMNVVDLNTRGTYEQITQLDFAAARFYSGISALCGTMFAPYMNPRDPWPRPDERMMPWGSPVDADYPERIGTLDMSAPYGPFTMRDPDYETVGGARFWWQEFQNVLWLVRGDPPPQGTNTYGQGSLATCILPPPQSGGVWRAVDFTTTYVNPTRGWTTRNNSPTVNNGSLAGANGLSPQLLPWHAQMFVPGVL